MLFAAFVCSLLLKSRKQFLWYLKLDNFKLMLLLFPVSAFFFSVFLLLPSSFPPFLLSSLPLPHSPDFYCWNRAKFLTYHFVLYPHQSMFSIRQNVFTRRVLIDSVPPVFQFPSSNSFVFHILFSFFNIIFRIYSKVRYQNLCSRMCSLLYLSAAC